MKQLNYISFLFLAFSLVTACDILEVDPPVNLIASESVITDRTGLEAAVNGVYDALQSGAIVLDYVVIADLAADNLTAVGSKIDYVTIDNHNAFASNIYIESVWNAHYEVINRANNVIANLDQEITGVSQTLKDKIKGEMLFIRSYCHFNLVRMYGGIPLRTSPVASANNDAVFIGRAPIDQVYQQINEDLQLASSLLEGGGAGPSVLISEPAVLALQARVKLHLKEWSEAEQLANKVISDFGYSLEENYASIFDETTTNNEIIFQVDFLNDDDVNTIANWLLASGRYEAAATEDIYFLYDGFDARADVSTGLAGTTDYFCNKYTGLQNDKDNFIVLRLAEMYLIAAEAANEQSVVPTSAAFSHLNAIRERANLDPLTNLDLPNKEAFQAAIAEERRKELSFEGHRWFDLVRTGKAQEVLGITNPNKLLFPIPQSEIDTNLHPDMNQNDDY